MLEFSKLKYYSKLLLFGEYTIIDGGEALAIPFEKYFGYWQKGQQKKDTQAFFSHLRSLIDAQQDIITKALTEEWYFKSNIPSGYGCGSSGALTAASYGQFFTHKQLDIEHLKDKLASIESFFHGKSSGLDPLVSYLNKGILYKKNNAMALDTFPSNKALFLLDSNKERSTSQWVNIFLEKQKSSIEFRKQLEQLTLLNEQAIAAFILNDEINLVECYKKISYLQRVHFEEMIPSEVKSIWDKGLESGAYYIKLLGAGGGGFFLGMSLDENLNLDRIPIWD